MLELEIDLFDAQPSQACLAGLLRVLRAPIYTQILAVGRTNVAELRGQHNSVPAAAKRAPHQFFIAADSIHIGRVEEIYPPVNGAMNGGMDSASSVEP
jgi:hypothetical protein